MDEVEGEQQAFHIVQLKSEHVGCIWEGGRCLKDPSSQALSLTGSQQNVQKDAAKMLGDKYVDSFQEFWETQLQKAL